MNNPEKDCPTCFMIECKCLDPKGCNTDSYEYKLNRIKELKKLIEDGRVLFAPELQDEYCKLSKELETCEWTKMQKESDAPRNVGNYKTKEK